MKCLHPDPAMRPTARELLFHPALFEIPSLKLLSVHSLADDIRKQRIVFTCDRPRRSLLIITVGLKPDRSFVSPFYHLSSPDKTFAESESIREGVKPVIFTYATSFLAC
jgi:nuclear receptor-binding protein